MIGFSVCSNVSLHQIDGIQIGRTQQQQQNHHKRVISRWIQGQPTRCSANTQSVNPIQSHVIQSFLTEDTHIYRTMKKMKNGEKESLDHTEEAMKKKQQKYE